MQRNEVADFSAYEPPRVTMHGTLVERTQAQVAGTVTDRTFPAGTPIQDLTFSGP
jgi:hypothetical protein